MTPFVVCRWVLVATLAALTAGCPHMPTGRVRLVGSETCQVLSPAELVALAPRLGPTTATNVLMCQLATLREVDAADLRRSSVGARVCRLLAERSTDGQQREMLASEGVRFAERALAAGPDADPLTHYYLAVNLGLAVRNHLALAVKTLPRLVRELERAKKLTPAEDAGGPLRMLGVIYFTAPPWPRSMGDPEKAVELLKEAVTKHPAHPLNHLFYAQALFRAEAAPKAEIRKQIEEGLTLLANGDWGHSRDPWKHEFVSVMNEVK